MDYDYNEWNNYIALGYLKYALERYNEVAANDENEYRSLTDEEADKLRGCMRYAFDRYTLKEAYHKG